jgi:monooxygenase
MDRKGYAYCAPVLDEADTSREPLLDFSSGYVQRAVDLFPKQGSARPWRMGQSYVHDYLAVRLDRLEDGVLRFSKA